MYTRFLRMGSACRAARATAGILAWCAMVLPAYAQTANRDFFVAHGALTTGAGGPVAGAVSVRRDLAVVGGDGVTRVFSRATLQDSWEHVATLTPSDGAIGFGGSVATNGRAIVVGSLGAAYVFHPDTAGTWQQAARLAPPEGAGLFGVSVAMEERTLVVGAIASRGAAYVFEQGGDPGEWSSVAKLSDTDPPPVRPAPDLFGSSVAIEGDTVIVGAKSGTLLSSVMRAFVFERHGGGPNAWGRSAILPVQGFSFEEHVPRVSISGETAIVGGSAAGRAVIFERHEGGPNAWGRVADLYPAAGSPGLFFGNHVALNGDLAVVASGQPSGNTTVAGVTYVFARNQGGANAWGEVARLDVPRPQFGNLTNAVDRDTVLAGANIEAYTADVDGDGMRDRSDPCPRDPLNNEAGRCRRNSAATPDVGGLLELVDLSTRTSGGEFHITATFTNASDAAIRNAFFEVTELTGGNLVVNTDEGWGGVGATLTPDAGDGLLSPGESVTVVFVVRLATRNAFRFQVGARGDHAPLDPEANH